MGLLELDQQLTGWFYRQGALSSGVQTVFYTAASIFIYLLPLIALYLFFRSYRDRIQSIKIVVAVVIVWQVLGKIISTLLYNMYGFRDRPFADYGIQELFFERPMKAFPSDHAAVLMIATLLFFYYRYPKLGWLFLVGGVISSLSRVVVGFHWFGDVLGGWALAFIVFFLVRALDRPLTGLIEKTLQLLRLNNRADQLR